jgi:hypothetical protein
MVNITKKYVDIENTYRALRKHVDSFWPGNPKEELTYEKDPMKSMLPNWRVLEIAPKENSELWVYLTQGAWEITKDELYEKGRYGLEFLITSRQKSYIHVESLAMATIYHANPSYRIKLGDTLDIGRGWIDGSSCDHFLVSLPYPFPHELETIRVNDIYVSIWWLIPITKSEAQYAQVNGPEALEKKFEDVGLNCLDINRKPVI